MKNKVNLNLNDYQTQLDKENKTKLDSLTLATYDKTSYTSDDLKYQAQTADNIDKVARTNQSIANLSTLNSPIENAKTQMQKNLKVFADSNVDNQEVAAAKTKAEKEAEGKTNVLFDLADTLQKPIYAIEGAVSGAFARKDSNFDGMSMEERVREGLKYGWQGTESEDGSRIITDAGVVASVLFGNTQAVDNWSTGLKLLVGMPTMFAFGAIDPVMKGFSLLAESKATIKGVIKSVRERGLAGNFFNHSAYTASVDKSIEEMLKENGRVMNDIHDTAVGMFKQKTGLVLTDGYDAQSKLTMEEYNKIAKQCFEDAVMSKSAAFDNISIHYKNLEKATYKVIDDIIKTGTAKDLEDLDAFKIFRDQYGQDGAIKELRDKYLDTSEQGIEFRKKLVSNLNSKIYKAMNENGFNVNIHTLLSDAITGRSLATAMTEGQAREVASRLFYSTVIQDHESFVNIIKKTLELGDISEEEYVAIQKELRDVELELTNGAYGATEEELKKLEKRKSKLQKKLGTLTPVMREQLQTLLNLVEARQIMPQEMIDILDHMEHLDNIDAQVAIENNRQAKQDAELKRIEDELKVSEANRNDSIVRLGAIDHSSEVEELKNLQKDYDSGLLKQQDIISKKSAIEFQNKSNEFYSGVEELKDYVNFEDKVAKPIYDENGKVDLSKLKPDHKSLQQKQLQFLSDKVTSEYINKYDNLVIDRTNTFNDLETLKINSKKETAKLRADLKSRVRTIKSENEGLSKDEITNIALKDKEVLDIKNKSTKISEDYNSKEALHLNKLENIDKKLEDMSITYYSKELSKIPTVSHLEERIAETEFHSFMKSAFRKIDDFEEKINSKIFESQNKIDEAWGKVEQNPDNEVLLEKAKTIEETHSAKIEEYKSQLDSKINEITSTEEYKRNFNKLMEYSKSRDSMLSKLYFKSKLLSEDIKKYDELLLTEVFRINTEDTNVNVYKELRKDLVKQKRLLSDELEKELSKQIKWSADTAVAFKKGEQASKTIKSTKLTNKELVKKDALTFDQGVRIDTGDRALLQDMEQNPENYPPEAIAKHKEYMNSESPATYIRNNQPIKKVIKNAVMGGTVQNHATAIPSLLFNKEMVNKAFLKRPRNGINNETFDELLSKFNSGSYIKADNIVEEPIKDVFTYTDLKKQVETTFKKDLKNLNTNVRNSNFASELGLSAGISEEDALKTLYDDTIKHIDLAEQLGINPDEFKTLTQDRLGIRKVLRDKMTSVISKDVKAAETPWIKGQDIQEIQKGRLDTSVTDNLSAEGEFKKDLTPQEISSMKSVDEASMQTESADSLALHLEDVQKQTQRAQRVEAQLDSFNDAELYRELLDINLDNVEDARVREKLTSEKLRIEDELKTDESGKLINDPVSLINGILDSKQIKTLVQPLTDSEKVAYDFMASDAGIKLADITKDGEISPELLLRELINRKGYTTTNIEKVSKQGNAVVNTYKKAINEKTLNSIQKRNLINGIIDSENIDKNIVFAQNGDLIESKLYDEIAKNYPEVTEVKTAIDEVSNDLNNLNVFGAKVVDEMVKSGTYSESNLETLKAIKHGRVKELLWKISKERQNKLLKFMDEQKTSLSDKMRITTESSEDIYNSTQEHITDFIQKHNENMLNFEKITPDAISKMTALQASMYTNGFKSGGYWIKKPVKDLLNLMDIYEKDSKALTTEQEVTKGLFETAFDELSNIGVISQKAYNTDILPELMQSKLDEVKTRIDSITETLNGAAKNLENKIITNPELKQVYDSYMAMNQKIRHLNNDKNNILKMGIDNKGLPQDNLGRLADQKVETHKDITDIINTINQKEVQELEKTHPAVWNRLKEIIPNISKKQTFASSGTKSLKPINFVADDSKDISMDIQYLNKIFRTPEMHKLMEPIVSRYFKAHEVTGSTAKWGDEIAGMFKILINRKTNEGLDLHEKILDLMHNGGKNFNIKDLPFLNERMINGISDSISLGTSGQQFTNPVLQNIVKQLKGIVPATVEQLAKDMFKNTHIDVSQLMEDKIIPAIAGLNKDASNTLMDDTYKDVFDKIVNENADKEFTKSEAYKNGKKQLFDQVKGNTQFRGSLRDINDIIGQNLLGSAYSKYDYTKQYYLDNAFVSTFNHLGKASEFMSYSTALLDAARRGAFMSSSKASSQLVRSGKLDYMTWKELKDTLKNYFDDALGIDYTGIKLQEKTGLDVNDAVDAIKGANPTNEVMKVVKALIETHFDDALTEGSRIYMPKPVKNILNDWMKDSKQSKSATEEILGEALNWWKKVTLLSPGFQVKNIAGNWASTYLINKGSLKKGYFKKGREFYSKIDNMREFTNKRIMDHYANGETDINVIDGLIKKELRDNVAKYKDNLGTSDFSPAEVYTLYKDAKNHGIYGPDLQQELHAVGTPRAAVTPSLVQDAMRASTDMTFIAKNNPDMANFLQGHGYFGKDESSMAERLMKENLQESHQTTVKSKAAQMISLMTDNVPKWLEEFTGNKAFKNMKLDEIDDFLNNMDNVKKQEWESFKKEKSQREFGYDTIEEMNKDMHFDQGLASNFEKSWMKMIFPFWGFMKKSLQLSLNRWNKLDFTGIYGIERLIEHLMNNQDISTADMSEYSRNEQYIPIKLGDNNIMQIKWGNPVGSINRFLNSDKNIVAEVFSNANPLLKFVVSSAAGGKDLFYGGNYDNLAQSVYGNMAPGAVRNAVNSMKYQGQLASGELDQDHMRNALEEALPSIFKNEVITDNMLQKYDNANNVLEDELNKLQYNEGYTLQRNAAIPDIKQYQDWILDFY